METSWSRRPVIYEINTWVWLNALSHHYKQAITLGTIPMEQWDALASLRVDAVWLMGVWERSPEGIRIANENVGLQADFLRALPDYTSADNVGSAYSVRRYVVDAHLGGPKGLATARQMLTQRGLRLILDFVPNHVAAEHPWDGRVAGHPPEEYWCEVISAVRLQHPNVLFLAEVYWDLEWELMQLGFDYCYDKRLYDRLERDSAESIRLHLTAGLDYQDKLVRFIENHDEARAAARFSPEKERAAAVTMMTLPGAKLLYEGQCEGWRVSPPVFLGRRPVEPIDADLRAFYHTLLAAVKGAGLREGVWQLCERTGWPDNSSYLNLGAWCWDQGRECYLVIVNLSEYRSQGRIRLPRNELAGRTWYLTDVLSGDIFERDGGEMQSAGLYVDLSAWKFHFLRFQSDRNGEGRSFHLYWEEDHKKQ